MSRLAGMLAMIVSVGALTLNYGCQTNAATQPNSVEGAGDEAPVRGARAILTVHGMSCPLCANNIDKQMMKLDGVTKVAVDLGSGTVSVDLSGDKRPTRRQLSDAIHNSGFTLTHVEIQ